MAAAVDVTLFEVTRFVEQGDMVVALGRWGGRASRTGKPFESDWAMTWTFDAAGKVKHYQAFENTHAVAKAFVG